jgi:uncharacterized protein YecA (UPF0149 family)
MASTAQLNANRQNATHSTGPVTETGKANASRNHFTRGLYTQADYVKPEERELYKQFRETMLRELEPATLLEQSLAAEITGATWRLRRCANAEAELADYALTDPLLDESKEKSIRSIERARSAAHSQLHRSINQLRKLQTCRESGAPVSGEEQLNENDPFTAALLANCEPDPEIIRELDAQVEAAREAERNAKPRELASNCNAPRNAPCPCGSGLKFKRCCARKGPAWSHLNDLPTAA